MPEGPEIRLISEELNDQFQGKYCDKLKTRIRYHRSDYEGSLTINSICKKIYSIGKKIIFKFENGLIFISSCLMEGRWFFKIDTEYLIKIEFENRNLYLVDPTLNTLFSIVNKNSQNHKYILKDLGEDYFDISKDEFMEKITRSRISNRNIQDFLMNQSEFSGIGNYLKSEILYMAKIHPLRKLSDLSRQDIRFLFHCIKFIMDDSYRNGGYSFSSYLSPSGNRGFFSPEIYMRKYDKMGNKIETLLDKNKRVTYFVNSVQT